MGSDCYKVDVVHYVNPHLIWVITRKQGEGSQFSFEQIGLYGVLPQNVTIDMDCVLKTEVSEDWLPAAVVAMTKSFHDADEVWFSPTFIDKKSSIFDDNTHKFGDICIIRKDGSTANLAAEIVQSGFAYINENIFHHKLVTSTLKTKLGYVAEHDVLKKLKEGYLTRGIPEKIWLLVLQRQTLVFEEAQQLEESIRNRKMVLHGNENLETVLRNKMNDLKLCKDVDEVSAGRANTIRRFRPTAEATKDNQPSVNWKNKFEWLAQKARENRKRSSEPDCNMTFSSDETNVNYEERKPYRNTRNANNRNFRNNNDNYRDNRNDRFSNSEVSQSSSSSGVRDFQLNSFNDHDDQGDQNNQRYHLNNPSNYNVTQTNYRNTRNNYRGNQNNDGSNQNYNSYNRNPARKPPRGPDQEARNIAYGPAGLSHTKFMIKPRSEDIEERRRTAEEANIWPNTTPEVQESTKFKNLLLRIQRSREVCGSRFVDSFHCF